MFPEETRTYKCFPPCVGDLRSNYYFGGHVIARQGFKRFQIQGVEFKQLGQGGGSVTIPFTSTLRGKTPADTYVKNSSINESMTRWIVLHSTSA